MHNISDRAYILIGVLFLALLSVFVIISLYGSLPYEHDRSSVLFEVRRGEGLSAIAQRLEEERIISNQDVFILYALSQGISHSLQAGSYHIPSPTSLREIGDMLSSGQIAERIIIIPEGWNLNDIALSFEQEGIISSPDELFEVTGHPLGNHEGNNTFRDQFSFLADKPDNVSMEGYFFPDTYRVSYREDVSSVLEIMLKNFDAKLSDELRQEIVAQEKTIFEVVTIASLLEKEVLALEEKQIVSGIIQKRMASGIPLQLDATVTYITGKRSTAVSVQDTQIESPYNTYQVRGLPKGPIANPGIESIYAALYPQESPYWFYLSTPEGETMFSRTFQEHINAKERYLR